MYAIMDTYSKGHSTNRLPLFDGTNYQFWSNKMSIYMRSYDYHMWNIIVDGLFVYMRKIKGSEELEPKQMSEWTNIEIKKIQINFKAINTLYCALNPTYFCLEF